MKKFFLLAILLAGCKTWRERCVERGGTVEDTNCREESYLQNIIDLGSGVYFPIYGDREVCDQVCRVPLK